jgi:hypothetical protein
VGDDKLLPLSIDFGGFAEQHKERFESEELLMRLRVREPEAVALDRARGDVPELRRDLRGHLQGVLSALREATVLTATPWGGCEGWAERRKISGIDEDAHCASRTRCCRLTASSDSGGVDG